MSSATNGLDVELWPMTRARIWAAPLKRIEAVRHRPDVLKLDYSSARLPRTIGDMTDAIASRKVAASVG